MGSQMFGLKKTPKVHMGAFGKYQLKGSTGGHLICKNKRNCEKGMQERLLALEQHFMSDVPQ